MRGDKQVSAKSNVIRKAVLFAAAAVIAVMAASSVFIIRARADGKNINDKNVGAPDNDTAYTTEAKRENEEETQVKQEYAELTDDYILRCDDMDIAGSDKKGRVYFCELSGAEGGTSELSLWVDGEMIWTSDNHMAVSTAHVGQTSYYAVKADGKNCFMEYTPYVGQGTGTAYYEVFTVDINGKEELIDRDGVGFILKKKSSGEGYFPIYDMVAFAREAEEYIDGGRLLVSTVNGTFEYDNAYDKANTLFPYLKFIYPWIYEQAALSQLDLSRCSSLEETLVKLEQELPTVSEAWDSQIDIMKSQIDDLCR
ncbi:MAG: hypothetical protein NC223_11470 [Butyrivibrio sp.]|nr:hypothetical protein [Butyrivibrio sp.]